jgi:two-component system, OmpR family, sensor histidine kinase KdpD
MRPRLLTALRYGASLTGVATITLMIALVLPRYHIANISMIYLLLILALAVFAGSGPAILASILAFLAFDWFFVPPVGRFTVADPSEWLALFLFLVVAIISGQLAASLRYQAGEARRRARETETLYEMSMEILGDVRVERTLRTIADRMLHTLDLRNVAVFLLRPAGELDLIAEAGEPLEGERADDRRLHAQWALQAGSAADQRGRAGAIRLIRPAIRLSGDRSISSETLQAIYMPIVLGSETLGVVAAALPAGVKAFESEQRRLLEAFVAQAALAISRARLREEEEKARAAEESERMKSIFLASVSHDLRTPLTAIKAAAEGLREDAVSRSDDAHRDLAEGIDEEVQRLDRLVGNLLEISRIESGDLPLRRAPEDLSEVIGTVVGRLTPVLHGRSLSVEIPDDLPLIQLDAMQIDRVLTNLIENAIKFSPQRSRIAVIASIEGDQMLIRVWNSGTSLSAEERHRIFDKFYRIDSAGAGRAGVGLGLAICKGIVEAHGGDIRAENENQGVSFIIKIPLTDPIRKHASARLEQ